jgi:hypothetical protein
MPSRSLVPGRKDYRKKKAIRASPTKTKPETLPLVPLTPLAADVLLPLVSAPVPAPVPAAAPEEPATVSIPSAPVPAPASVHVETPALLHTVASIPDTEDTSNESKAVSASLHEPTGTSITEIGIVSASVSAAHTSLPVLGVDYSQLRVPDAAEPVPTPIIDPLLIIPALPPVKDCIQRLVSPAPPRPTEMTKDEEKPLNTTPLKKRKATGMSSCAVCP